MVALGYSLGGSHPLPTHCCLLTFLRHPPHPTQRGQSLASFYRRGGYFSTTFVAATPRLCAARPHPTSSARRPLHHHHTCSPHPCRVSMSGPPGRVRHRVLYCPPAKLAAKQFPPTPSKGNYVAGKVIPTPGSIDSLRLFLTPPKRASHLPSLASRHLICRANKGANYMPLRAGLLGCKLFADYKG